MKSGLLGSLIWPRSDDILLFWSQTLALWIVFVYLVAPFHERLKVSRDAATSKKQLWTLFASTSCWLPVALLLIVSAWSGGWRATSIGLVLSALYVSVIWLRARGTQTFPRPFRADVLGDAAYEIAALILAALITALLAGSQNLYPIRGLVGVGPDLPRVVATILSTGLMVLLLRGGDILVEEILSQTGVLPVTGAKESSSGPTGRDTLRHGRLIGYTERIIIAAVVATGNYDALGFIIAAKGFIRSGKALNAKAEAEYFLVGTLFEHLPGCHCRNAAASSLPGFLGPYASRHDQRAKNIVLAAMTIAEKADKKSGRTLLALLVDTAVSFF